MPFFVHQCIKENISLYPFYNRISMHFLLKFGPNITLKCY
jgi:hypothetical protein